MGVSSVVWVLQELTETVMNTVIFHPYNQKYYTQYKLPLLSPWCLDVCVKCEVLVGYSFISTDLNAAQC